MQQQQDQGWRMTHAQAFNILYLLLNSHKMCFTVFMRRDFGTRAFDPYGMVALGMLVIMAAAHRWMRLYLAAWFVALVWRRIESYRVRWRGQEGHSQYQGFPWLAMRWPGMKTEKDAKEFEPLICVMVGCVVATIYPPMGAFIAFGLISCVGCMWIGDYVETQRMRAMKDAEHEMRYYAEKWREKR